MNGQKPVRQKRSVGTGWLPAILLMSLAVLVPTAAGAVQPDEILKDPALEQRAKKLSVELRCLVCQNQSIDDSDAPLARDLRVLVREQLSSGRTDDEVLDFIVARYGEFVLLRPRFGLHTLALWGTPVVALLLGIWLAVIAHRRRAADAGARVRATPLSAEEQRRLAALTGSSEEKP